MAQLSSKSQPKARFSIRMPNGDFLGLTVWPGKTDPNAEVLTVQVRRMVDQKWETVGRLAVYRSSTGNYSQLPERQITRENATAATKEEPVENE